MKSILKISLFFSLTSCLWASISWSKGLSYEEIPLYVQEKNEFIKSLREEEKSYQVRLDHLKRSFIPKLETYAGQEEFDSDAFGSHSSFFYGVSGSLNLYNASRDKLEEEKRKEILEVSKIETLMTKKELTYTAESLYLTLANHKAKKDIYQKAIKRVSDLEKQVKQKVSSGVISNSDLTSLDLLRNQYRDEINELERHSASALSKFSILVGKEGLDISDISSGVLSRSVDVSKENLRPLQFNLEKQKEKIHNIQAEKESNGSIPSVDLFADYGKLPFSEREISDSSDREEWRTGIKVSWDIGGIWESQSLTKQSNALAKSAQYRQQYAKKNARALYNALLSKEQLLRESNSSLASQVSMGKKYLSQIQDEYLRGVKSTSDLNSALNQLLEFQKRRIENQQQYRLMKAQLDKLSGEN